MRRASVRRFLSAPNKTFRKPFSLPHPILLRQGCALVAPGPAAAVWSGVCSGCPALLTRHTRAAARYAATSRPAAGPPCSCTASLPSPGGSLAICQNWPELGQKAATILHGMPSARLPSAASVAVTHHATSHTGDSSARSRPGEQALSN